MLEELFKAIKEQDTLQAINLIDKMDIATLNQIHIGFNALQFASQRGNIEIVQKLLNTGVDIKAKNVINGGGFAFCCIRGTY